MNPVRRRYPAPWARIGPTLACLALLNGCFKVAGGSGDTGNPELEIALDIPGGASAFSGSLRLYAGDHDPMVDSLPLHATEIKGRAPAKLSMELLGGLLDKAGAGGPVDTLDFNCLVSGGAREAFMPGFRLVRQGVGVAVQRMEGGEIRTQDAGGRLSARLRLDSALVNLRGRAHGEGLEDEVEWVALPGTPYLARVREGGFRFERIARGSYPMVAVLRTGEKFHAAAPFLTDSAERALAWHKEPLAYRATDSGLYLHGVDSGNPLIYDNDLYSGGIDDEYMWARASLGADLRGIIATREMSFSTHPDTLPGGYTFTLQFGLNEAAASVARARRSGMRNLPDPVAGAGERLVRPESGRIRDTRATASPGADLIISAAAGATPRKPLVVFVGGGQATTVANAYLLDPSIATRMVVIGTGLDGKTKDPWAATILAKRCKLVNFGESLLWWPQRPIPTLTPPARYRDLPKNEVTAALDSISTLNWENSIRPVDPARDGGFNDGAGLFLVFAPRSWREAARMRVHPDGTHGESKEGAPFDLIHATRCEFDAMTEAYFSALGDPRTFALP